MMTDSIPGCSGFEFPWEWKRSWSADSDNDDVKKSISYGYVDNQSLGVIWFYIKKRGIDPLDFVYDSHYIIVIDGDECCVWDGLEQARVIDTANIVEEYPGMD